MNRIIRMGIALVVVMIGVGGAAPALGQNDAPTAQALCEAAAPEAPAAREFAQAEDVLQAGADYWAVLCTDAGPIVVDLLQDEAPITVNNFVFLAQQGYYNDTTFHRVLPGFMAQGGDPTGSGAGGPGYEFADETANGLTFDRAGLLAMANAGPNTNGSQFFITYAPTPWLDGNHTIFGRVVQGMSEAELLTRRNPEEMPQFDGSALRAVLILEDSSEVQVTPDAAPDIAHIQAMLENNIIPQLSEQFILSAEASHAYDLDAEAQSWAAADGEDLAAYLRGYLGEHGFQGSAALHYALLACDPAMPIWGLSLQVYDYGTEGAGDAVTADDARADGLVAFGAYQSQTAVEGLGRVFQRAASDQTCGSGTQYRLEIPYGRYALVVEMTVDDAAISADTDPTAQDYLGYLAQQFLGPAVTSALDRGNADTAAE